MLPAQHTNPEERKIKLVITDDHRIFRQAVMKALEQYPDIEVIGEAENGAELLDKLRVLQPDVITLDLMMPVMNGVDTLKQLKKDYPAIKIVILSMYDDPAVITTCIKLGAHSYLTCDEEPPFIYEAISACFHQGIFINKKIQEALVSVSSKPVSGQD